MRNTVPSMVSCDNLVFNPKMVRMNCLALACINEQAYDKIAIAESYNHWVLTGERMETKLKLEISDSGKKTTPIPV